jgi:hypothetical protein
MQDGEYENPPERIEPPRRCLPHPASRDGQGRPHVAFQQAFGPRDRGPHEQVRRPEHGPLLEPVELLGQQQGPQGRHDRQPQDLAKLVRHFHGWHGQRTGCPCAALPRAMSTLPMPPLF